MGPPSRVGGGRCLFRRGLCPPPHSQAGASWSGADSSGQDHGFRVRTSAGRFGRPNSALSSPFSFGPAPLGCREDRPHPGRCGLPPLTYPSRRTSSSFRPRCRPWHRPPHLPARELRLPCPLLRPSSLVRPRCREGEVGGAGGNRSLERAEGGVPSGGCGVGGARGGTRERRAIRKWDSHTLVPTP